MGTTPPQHTHTHTDFHVRIFCSFHSLSFCGRLSSDYMNCFVCFLFVLAPQNIVKKKNLIDKKIYEFKTECYCAYTPFLSMSEA